MRVLYLYLVLSLLSTSVYADQDSIIIHRVQLKLGMPEKTTMKVLSQIYDLKIVKGLADYWVIFEKGSKFKYVGSISFKEGNVSSVSRNIGTYEGKTLLNLQKHCTRRYPTYKSQEKLFQKRIRMRSLI